MFIAFTQYERIKMDVMMKTNETVILLHSTIAIRIYRFVLKDSHINKEIKEESREKGK